MDRLFASSRKSPPVRDSACGPGRATAGICLPLLALTIVGCTGTGRLPFEEACDVMVNGPSQTIEGAREPYMGSDDADDEGIRYDIVMFDGGGSWRAFVDLVVSVDSQYHIYLSTDPFMDIWDSGSLVSPVARLDEEVEACGAIAVGHSAYLASAAYELQFGPDEVSEVSFVVIRTEAEEEE